jgi:hypothetical protein
LSSLAHPGFASVRRWLEASGGDLDRLTLPELNAAARAASPPIVSATGAPIRFVAAEGRQRALDYETRIHDRGEVATRIGARHDLLNALCWLSFPRMKRRCNAQHVLHASSPGGRRGAVRDATTLFDESGVIALCRDPSLGKLLGARRWKTLFCERRGEVAEALAFFVCGHAVLEKLLDPYPGITARLLIVGYDEEFERVDAGLCAEADRRAAVALDAISAPADVPPLPLAGIPGWDPRNADPAFYDDARIFRPAHAAIAGGSASTVSHSAAAPAPSNSSREP